MKTKLLYFLIIAIAITSLTSCRKKGCTDPDAENYNPKAEISDHTCVCRYLKDGTAFRMQITSFKDWPREHHYWDSIPPGWDSTIAQEMKFVFNNPVDFSTGFVLLPRCYDTTWYYNGTDYKINIGHIDCRLLGHFDYSTWLPDPVTTLSSGGFEVQEGKMDINYRDPIGVSISFVTSNKTQ